MYDNSPPPPLPSLKKKGLHFGISNGLRLKYLHWDGLTLYMLCFKKFKYLTKIVVLIFEAN